MPHQPHFCEGMEHKSLPLRCGMGAVIITLVELATGMVVNHLLGLQVWDYSDVPMNIFGQVCLPYSLLWFGLSLPAMALCEVCKKTRSFF